MSEMLTIREGTTNTIQMKLLSNGTVIDLSGCAYVSLVMVDSKDKTYRYTSVDSSTYATIASSYGGIVQLTPPSTTTFLYQHNPYNIYWWVNVSSSQRYSVPENGVATINVLKDY